MAGRPELFEGISDFGEGGKIVVEGTLELLKEKSEFGFCDSSEIKIKRKFNVVLNS